MLLPFILIGLWLAFRHGGIRSAGGWRAFSQSPLALISLLMLVYSVLHVFTWAMPRYRLPVDAILLIYAGLAVSILWARLERSRRATEVIESY